MSPVRSQKNSKKKRMGTDTRLTIFSSERTCSAKYFLKSSILQLTGRVDRSEMNGKGFEGFINVAYQKNAK